MKKRIRRWLHFRDFHWFCRVIVRRVQVSTRYETGPEYLVGTSARTGEEIRVDATVFGGRRVPVYDWRWAHG